MSKKSLIILIVSIVAIAAIWFAYDRWGAMMQASAAAGGSWLVPVVIFAAIVDSINPCALSVILISIGVLFSMGKSRREVVKFGSVYVFGVFLVYVGIGLIGLWFLSTLDKYNVHGIIRSVASIVLIAVGALGIINELYPSFPIKLKIPSSAHPKMAALLQRASLPGAFLLGALVSLYEFPCTGGPYLLVMSLLGGQGTFLTGFALLILYNVIFVSPLIIILVIASDQALLEKAKIWKKEKLGGAGLWTGIAMIGLGILILML